MLDDPLAAFRLEGKVAVLTGASSGIGARFARVLDASGVRLVLAARRVELLEQIAAECRDAIVVPTDMRDEREVERLVADAVDAYGRIDVLVNNAGAAAAKPAFRDDLADVRRVIDVDLLGPYLLSVLVGRHMKESGAGGSIVNIASISGLSATSRLPMGGYAAAKGGLVNLTRDLATQWGRYGIRVNAIAPGWFNVGMGSWVSGDPEFRAWLEGRIAAQRLGRPEELDGTLVFLASAASSYITGQTIVVDGGWSVG